MTVLSTCALLHRGNLTDYNCAKHIIASICKITCKCGHSRRWIVAPQDEVWGTYLKTIILPVVSYVCEIWTLTLR
jgi:hypothetical protein